MLLPKGRTTYKYLREADPQFDATDMLGVTYTNKGNTIAIINGEDVYPEESFVTPYNVVQDGRFSITFKGVSNPQAPDKNLVLIKYTKITGAYNLQEKVMKSKC